MLSARTALSLALPLFTLLSTADAHAQNGNDRYYVVLFGYESPLNLAALSHSFATFVRQDGVTGDITEKTIGWLPARLSPNLSVCVHLLFPRRCPPETGHNYGLDETIDLALYNNRNIYRAGPFEVDRSLWDLAGAQIAQLESGYVQYVARDNRTHGLRGNVSTQAVNCVHALTDITGAYLPRTPRWGFMGTLDVLSLYAPWIVDWTTSSEWVAQELGVDFVPRLR